MVHSLLACLISKCVSVSSGPYFCLHTELVGKALFVLQQPAFRVLQLLQLSSPALHQRQRGRTLLLSLSFPLSRSCTFTSTNSRTRDYDPHGLDLCAGLSTHFAQVENPKRLGCRGGRRMGRFWAVFGACHLQEGNWRRTSWQYVCGYLQDCWRFFSFHAITSTSDEHMGRTWKKFYATVTLCINMYPMSSHHKWTAV